MNCKYHHPVPSNPQGLRPLHRAEEVRHDFEALREPYHGFDLYPEGAEWGEGHGEVQVRGRGRRGHVSGFGFECMIGDGVVLRVIQMCGWGWDGW